MKQLRAIFATRHIVARSLLLSACATAVQAQSSASPSHRTTVGLLGAAQQGSFRVSDGLETFEQQVGWTTGVWLNVPLGKYFSIEPSVQYGAQPARQTSGQLPRSFLSKAAINGLSMPLMMKMHLGPVALAAGGQVDIPISVVDNPNVVTTENVSSANVAAVGGIELFSRSRVAMYGRYVYGFTNVDARQIAGQSTLYGQSIHAGVKVRLWGAGGGHGTRANDVRRSTVRPDANTDGDGDGVFDLTDRCPLVAGVVRNAGCPMPDADDDGVTDAFDKCPQVAGSVRYEGCVPADTDKDGVSDLDDRCPTTAGSAKFAGCEEPDMDRDGVPDATDRCVAVVGVSEMMGCPPISAYSASNVTFATGKSTMTDLGRRELDKVVDYLTAYPNVAVRIEGHTDNVGSDLVNNPLSERRADAAREYLLSRGVPAERLSSIGHGSTRPTMGNGTIEGRARNRRVEVSIR